MDQSCSRILVTSALPYANGAVHLGHLAGAYLPADIYVRFQRLRGRDVLFICGSDEHGVSILLSASKDGVTPQSIIDRYHEQNQRAFARAGIAFDNYSRTSLAVHHETAKEWFLAFHRAGILRQKRELQLFDEQARMFLPDRFVTGTCPHCGYDKAYGDQCENCSTYYTQTELLDPKSLLSGSTPVIREATHWYFPLGEFQDRLTAYVESHAGDWKDNVLQQVRSWLATGLSDRPITRDLTWGVSVPIDDAEGKVLYVWFEAVLGYISSTKEWASRQGTPDEWKKYWCAPEETRYIAFIGKDNIVFHCLMFPAMLMARGGYVLPDNVPANEFLNLEGRKFSKSRNWSIELDDFLDRYPPDPLRYTLTLNMPESKDTDFLWRDLQARTNNELADIVGNFVHRTLLFAHRTTNGRVPEAGPLSGADEAFREEFTAAAGAIAAQFERFHFRDGLHAAMNFARSCNKYFNDAEPWKTAKADPVRMATTINIALQAVYALGVFLEPVLPFTAAKLRLVLNLPQEFPWSWESAHSAPLPAGHALGEPEILFRKIEDDEIEREIAALGALTETAAPLREYAPVKETISYDDFSKLDLRIGMVVEAERVRKSEKLLRLTIDIGSEKRQVVAGIGKSYEPGDLVGRKIVILVNLAPAKLMGIESQGMLLAATGENGMPIVLTPAADVESGGIVR